MSKLMLLLCCVLWMSGCATFDPPPKTTAAITLSQALADVRNGIYEMQGSREECIKQVSAKEEKEDDHKNAEAPKKLSDSWSLSELQTHAEAADRCRKAGLLVKEVEVTFKITGAAKETRDSEVGIDPSNLLVEFPSAKFSRGSESSEERGNTIRFKFENVYLAGKDTLLGLDVQRRIDAMKAPQAKQGAKTPNTPVAQTGSSSPIDDAINGVGGTQLIMAELNKLEEIKQAIMALDPELEKKIQEIKM